MLGIDTLNSIANLGTTNGGTTNIYAGTGGVNIQGGDGGVQVLTGSQAGNAKAGINIQTGDSSTDNFGNITIDDGANVPSGTQVADYTFESSTENFGNYINVSVAQYARFKPTAAPTAWQPPSKALACGPPTSPASPVSPLLPGTFTRSQLGSGQIP